MAYKVLIKKSVIKGIAKIPPNIQKKFRALVEVLQASGTSGATGWPNFSKLEGNKYHCHLTYHYVACWTDEKGTLTIEVYYVGSRESAPYQYPVETENSFESGSGNQGTVFQIHRSCE